MRYLSSIIVLSRLSAQGSDLPFFTQLRMSRPLFEDSYLQITWWGLGQ